MVNRVIVIGTSAGGVEALQRVVRDLPPNVDAAIVVVMHLHPTAKSYLAEILGRVGQVPVISTEDGMKLEPGHIYVPRPDYHTLIQRDHLHLSHGPKENRYRPSINTLFRSAAQSFGPNAVGVILTGSLDDGTVGLWDIKRAGGLTVVQDPEEALFPDMPQNAIAHVEVDFIVKLSQIGPLLTTLVNEPAPQLAASAAPHGNGGSPGEGNSFMQSQMTDFTCPECHGAIREERLGTVLQYHCRIGHTYSASTMLEAHRDAEENALWAAVVALEEGAELSKQLARSVPETRDELHRAAEQKNAHAESIRNIIARIRRT